MKTKQLLTIDQALKAGNNGKNQDIKSRFVEQHVFCNVNTLVEYCLSKGYEDSESPVNFDEIENLYTFPEWSKKVLDENLFFEGGTQEDKDNFLEEFERIENESKDLLNSEEISEETHDRNVELIQQAKEEFEEATEESEPQEIFEWWAVSDFLFAKLMELGHPVVDTRSCKVWGRCTTGQAILLDYAITKICAEMEILEGQANSWA